MNEQDVGGVVYVDRSQPVLAILGYLNPKSKETTPGAPTGKVGEIYRTGCQPPNATKVNRPQVEDLVCEDIQKRAKLGGAKYGYSVRDNPLTREPSHPQYVVDAAKAVRQIDAHIPFPMPTALRIAVDYLDPTPQSRQWVRDVLAGGGVPFCIQADQAHRAAKKLRQVWPDPPPPVLAILDYLDPVAKQVTPEVYNQRVETCRTSCQQPNVANVAKAADRPEPDLRTMADAPKPNRPQVEDLVCEDIQKRAVLGRAKYGRSVRDNPLTREQWMQHAYEEALDFAVYMRRAKQDEVRVGDAVYGLEKVLRNVRMHGIGSPDPDVVANALDVLTTHTEALIAALRPKV